MRKKDYAFLADAAAVMRSRQEMNLNGLEYLIKRLEIMYENFDKERFVAEFRRRYELYSGNYHE